MADQKLRFIIEAVDNASKTLRNVQGAVKDMQPAFKAMAVAGGVAFGVISGIGISSLKAYADAQKEMVIANIALENALKGMTERQRETATGFTDLQGALGEMKHEMAEVGKAAIKLAFDDEEASKAFARLFQATGNATQAQKDIKLAMDLAAFSGRSLEEAAAAVTKVHAGAGRVLKEFNIAVDESQTPMEQLAVLQQKVGGTAEKMASTIEGQTKVIQLQMQNLRESIGASLAPAVGKLLQAVQPLVEKFAAWAEENPDLLAKILLIGGAVSGLLLVVGSIGLVLPSIIGGFIALASAAKLLAIGVGLISAPMWIFIAVVAAVIAAGWLLYKNWDTVKAFAIESWEAIRETVTSAMQAVMDFLAQAWEVIKSVFWTGVNFVIGAWATLLDFLFPGWQEALTNTIALTIQIFSEIYAYISGVVSQIVVAVSGALGAIWARWQEIWNAVKGFFVGIWEGIKAVATEAFSYIQSGIDAIMGPIQKFIDMAQKAYDAAQRVASVIGSAVKGGVSSIVSRGSSITGQRAIGGPVAAGQTYLVGERGPEYFTPATYGRIHANGGGALTLVITGNTFFSEEDMVDRVASQLMRELKTRLKI